MDELLWTAGVAAQSTVAANLHQPFVVLDFRLREGAPGDAAVAAAGATAPSATVRSEKVEVTLGQLAALEASLREALAALER